MGGEIARAGGSATPVLARIGRALKLREEERIDRYTRLPAVSDLHAVIAELEPMTQATTPERALVWAKMLVDLYPVARIDNPKVYARGLAALFGETPEDLCRKAVDLISREYDFPPSRAKVHKVLERLRRERAIEIGVAKAMLREHKRRREEAEETARREASRAAFREKHGDRNPLDVVLEQLGDTEQFKSRREA